MHSDWFLIIAYALIVLSFVMLIRAQKSVVDPKRFSLRGLLIFMTIVAVVLGVVVTMMRLV